ncbi:MAG: arsenosugar biosynthesis radical SAM (seleno)protein ArsS [Longimicrobiales bacterium]
MGRALPTLRARGAELASPAKQRHLLDSLQLEKSFPAALAESGLLPFQAVGITVLQINVGKVCNQTCRHCHVDAGPDREEVMSDDVVGAVLSVLEKTRIPTLDITGGAPELHPRFKELVTRARALGRHVMDRCNLTILTAPRFDHLPQFLAENRVEIVASLPHFSSRQTDAQRGEGVYEKSVLALRRLNALGYGEEGSGLVLNLVANPVGAFLPARQGALERDWRRELERRHGIRFNNLLTITNMPISRFLEFLAQSGNLERYMGRLVRAYNSAAAASVMCRYTLSVGWEGTLYDCDFNQMLDLPVSTAAPRTIQEFDQALLAGREIVLGPHCFGCTAGQGSSCGGATTD